MQSPQEMDMRTPSVLGQSTVSCWGSRHPGPRGRACVADNFVAWAAEA